MRWIAQLSEYWPLERLAAMTPSEMTAAMARQEEPEFSVSDGVLAAPKSGRCSRKLKAASSSEEGQKPSAPRDVKTPLSTSETTAGAAQNPVPSDPPTDAPLLTSRHSLDVPLDPPTSSKKGRILLVGSGPGHPSLLTIAAHKALTQLGTLILSDKLVPAQVLAQIPQNANVKLYIAKKYPGNSEGAQNELMDMAVEGAMRGEVVVRVSVSPPLSSLHY